MKNISQMKNNQNHLTEYVNRLNQITAFFRSAGRSNQAKMLNRLQLEIEQTKDVAVKDWLIRFDSILRALEVNNGNN